MAKYCCVEALDAALQYLEDNADWLGVCEGAVTTYEHAHSHLGTGAGKCLAHSATPTFTGPVADATGILGEKTTVDEEAAMTVDISSAGSGADHVALCDVGATKLLYVTTCTAQPLTAANTMTCPAWKIQIGAPT